MSMTTLRAYCRTKLNVLGYHEWVDGFNDDNIPDTKLNKSYHLAPPAQSEAKVLSEALEFKVRQSIDVMFSGYSDPAKAIDNAVKGQEDIIKAFMLASSRATQTFKNLIFKSAKIERVAQHNDNTAKLTLEFEADVFLDI